MLSLHASEAVDSLLQGLVKIVDAIGLGEERMAPGRQHLCFGIGRDVAAQYNHRGRAPGLDGGAGGKTILERKAPIKNHHVGPLALHDVENRYPILGGPYHRVAKILQLLREQLADQRLVLGHCHTIAWQPLRRFHGAASLSRLHGHQ